MKTAEKRLTQDDIPDELAYLRNIKDIFDHDLQIILDKDIRQYRGSWKKRGGVGAYFTFVRKIDSLVAQCDAGGYNIFKLCIDNGSGDGGTLEQVRDLRRYLALVEAELVQRAYVEGGRYKVVLEGLPGMPRAGGAVSKLAQEPQERPEAGGGILGGQPLPMPPLICLSVAMAYREYYATWANPFGLIYLILRQQISYREWKRLPNELGTLYDLPDQMDGEDMEAAVTLRKENRDTISAFCGPNNKSS